MNNLIVYASVHMLVIVIVIVVATVGAGMFLQHLRDFEENGRLKGLEG